MDPVHRPRRTLFLSLGPNPVYIFPCNLHPILIIFRLFRVARSYVGVIWDDWDKDF